MKRIRAFLLVGTVGLAVGLAGCGSTTTRTVTVVRTASMPSASTSAPPAPTIVLGAKRFMEPDGKGWGTAEPSTIFNGGDPSGLVSDIRWTGWGQPVALGSGKTSIFKPGRGYYNQLVTIKLRAWDIGSCTPGGPRAYLKLSVAEPSIPGGPLGGFAGWSSGGDLCPTTSTASPTSSTLTTTTATAPAQTSSDTLTVHDFNGNTLRVTAAGIIDPAAPANADVAVPAGTRLVAVELTLKGDGPGTISSDANSNTTVIGSDGQAYTPGFDPVTECTNFSDGAYTLLAGDTEKGCVVVQLPNSVTIKSVQFSLGNGTAQFNNG